MIQTNENKKGRELGKGNKKLFILAQKTPQKRRNFLFSAVYVIYKNNFSFSTVVFLFFSDQNFQLFFFKNKRQRKV